jgi:predicted phosphodiesterase
VCGHSHILRVISDPNRRLLHINPGAAGKHGFHKMRTLVRFDIENGKIDNMEVVELGKRGAVENEEL